MSTRRSLLQGALVIGCAALFGSPSQAGTPQVEANKAVARTFIESLGTAGYAAVAKKSLASDYKLARHEFENLKYNADDPVLKTAMQPDAKAIPDRANAIVKILGEGDTVAAMFRITGTHKGNLYGIPATGKPIDIEAAAVLKLKNGKITESWVLSNEAALLVQLGARLPERKDGKLNLAPVYDDVRSFDDSLQAWMAHPQDTPEYRHSKLLMAYKAKNKPDDYKFGNRPYQNLQRGGIDTIVARAAVLLGRYDEPTSTS